MISMEISSFAVPRNLQYQHCSEGQISTVYWTSHSADFLRRQPLCTVPLASNFQVSDFIICILPVPVFSVYLLFFGKMATCFTSDEVLWSC